MKKSNWTFNTSGGYSNSVPVGPVFVQGGVGSITLESPYGRDVRFHVASAGAGAGLSLPGKLKLKFPKLNAATSPAVGASASSEGMFSAGQVYMLEDFSGTELSVHDLEGWFMSHDASAGVLLAGYSGTLMLVGIPGRRLPIEVLREAPVGWLIHKIWPSVLRDGAKALLLMHGQTAGSIGFSGAQNIGYMWSDIPGLGGPRGQSMPNLDVPTVETVTTRSALASQDEADVIHLPGDALFAFDSYHIKPAAEAVLVQAAALIQQRSPHFRFLSVEGHTDAIGNADYNVVLSQHRANAVRHWLVNRNVMQASAIQIKGWGKRHPIAPNARPDGSDDPEGRQKNRRVEIWLMR